MKRSRFIILLQLLFILPLASCEKLNDLVKGDVTCKIDGKPWSSFSDDFKLAEAYGEVTYNWERVSINATNTKTSEKIGFTVSTPGKPVLEGKYVLNSESFLTGSYYLFNVGHFITGKGYQGVVEILNIDTVKSRIVGKFHFSCYNEENKQAVIVSEGRFDTQYTIHE